MCHGNAGFSALASTTPRYNAPIPLSAHRIVAFHGGVRGNPVLSHGACARLSYDSCMCSCCRWVTTPLSKSINTRAHRAQGLFFGILDLGFELNLATPLPSSRRTLAGKTVYPTPELHRPLCIQLSLHCQLSFVVIKRLMGGVSAPR